MNYKLEQIPISLISGERTFQISTASDDSRLAASIQDLGMLVPPILLEENGIFLVISGFRRIAVCRNLGWEAVCARIMAPGTDRSVCARYAIADNALQRSLNLIEMSRCFRLLEKFYHTIEPMALAAGSLGLPDSMAAIRKILPLCDMGLAIQKGVLAGTIPLPMALELGKMADGELLAHIFDRLRLSLNKQREVLTLSTEIALREGLSLAEFFEDGPVKDILEADTDRNFITRELRRYLRHRRFPALSAAEDQFDVLVKGLKLEPGIQLIAPPYFESQTYAFHLQFKNMAELAGCIAAVEKVTQSPALRQFWGDDQYVQLENG
jgi:hypothetical protein